MGLYKYVTAERIDILQNELIRFTQPTGLNDPFDMRIVADELLSEQTWASFDKDLETIALNDLIEYIITEAFKRSELENAHLKQYPHIRDEIMRRLQPPDRKILVPEALRRKEINNTKVAAKRFLNNQGMDVAVKFGVLSLTETPDNLLMWSHYATSHKGFVLELDTDHKVFSQPKSRIETSFRKVRYVERRKLKNLELESKGEYPLESFFLKSNYWSGFAQKVHKKSGLHKKY